MITLVINGHSQQIEADPNTPLLWALRDDLHLTGTKFGDAAGKSITTIEGLSGDVARAVTDAWIKAAVPQCGYCQPGFVMAVTCVLGANRSQTKEAVLSQITNICRCGTYDAIRTAVGFALDDLNPENNPVKKENVR